MSHEINGDDLFGKGTEGNLNKKGLKKAKKKELVEIIESNLPFLVEFYFGPGQRKDRKYIDNVYELVSAEKYFIDPLAVILAGGKGKKKKKKKEINLDDIPKGLHIVLLDSLDYVRSKYNERIREFIGKPKTGESSDEVNRMKAIANERIERLNDIITVLVRKDTKKLVKMGIKEEYAAELAATFVPDKYLTKYNVGRYLRRLNTTLVRIQNRAMTRSEYEDEDGQREYFNDAGLNLADDEVIMSIYEKFFEEVDRDVYLAGLTSVLLENRGKFVDNYSKPQREMYNAVSRVVMDLLEGHAVLNITGKKMKEKKLAKEVITKKELKKVMKNYSKRRAEDFRKGNDTPRRITIMNYDVDTYPKIIKAFQKENNISAQAVIDGSFDDHEEDNRPKNNNQKNNNNGKQNNNNQKKNNK